MKTEPVAVIAFAVTVLSLVAPGLVLFGLVDWTVDQLAFIETAIVAVSGGLGGLFARSKVTPV